MAAWGLRAVDIRRAITALRVLDFIGFPLKGVGVMPVREVSQSSRGRVLDEDTVVLVQTGYCASYFSWRARSAAPA